MKPSELTDDVSLIGATRNGNSPDDYPERFFVYTPGDGNEDGAFTGMDLDAAKALACRTSEELRRSGADSRAHVLECDTHNFVWGTGSELTDALASELGIELQGEPNE